MPKFIEQKFNIPELKGISTKNIEEHLKLYAGYVKFANLIGDKIEEYVKNADPSTALGAGNAYVLGELQRRFSFEFNGMRNHEYYFASLEGGSTPLTTGGTLMKALADQFESFDGWFHMFKSIALTRGIGWAILYYDQKTKQFVHTWVDEQHLGQLNGCQYVLGIDMWEHAYLYDYIPSEKKKYVEAFFENLNWGVIETNFKNTIK